MTKITTSQCVMFIVMIQIGVGILTLPSILTQEIHSLGWASVLIAGIIMQGIVFLYYFALNDSRESSFFEYLENLTGRVISRIIIFVLLMYFMGASSSILRSFVEIINIWIYPKTPTLILVILLWVCMFYLATSKAASIARLSQFFFILVLLLLSLLLWHLQKFNYNFLRPYSDVELLSLLRGSWQASLSLIGFELIFLLYFRLKKKNDLLRILTISNWITISLYLYVVIISTVLFPPEKLEKIIWPTLSLYKLIEFRFIQRLEYIVVLVWIPLIVITTGVYLWAAFKSTKFLFKIKKDYHSYFIAFFVLLLTMLPKTHPQIIVFADYVGYFGIIFSSLLPLFLIFLKVMRKKDKV